MKRVFILSSHPLFGKGIESLLLWEEGLTIVGHEVDPDRAIEQIKRLQPDVVIVDSKDSEAGRMLAVMSVFTASPAAPGKEVRRPCVIGLNMSDNMITIYHGEQRIIRSVSDFVEAVRDRAKADRPPAPEANADSR